MTMRKHDLRKARRDDQRGHTVLERIKLRTTAQPLQCAAIAAGAGFALSGGLLTPLVLRLVRRFAFAMVQVAIAPLIREEAGHLISALRHQSNGTSSQGT